MTSTYKITLSNNGSADYTYSDVNVKTSEDVRIQMLKINEMLLTSAMMSDGAEYFANVLKDGKNSRKALAEVAFCLYQLCEKTLPLITASGAGPGTAVTMTDLTNFKQEMMTALNTALETKLMTSPESCPSSETEEEVREEPESPTSFKLDVELPPSVEGEGDHEKSEDTDKEENPWNLVSRKGLAEKLGAIPTEDFTVKKGGKTATLKFGTKEAKEKAKETLANDYNVKDESKELKKLLPRLKLDRVDPSLLEGDKDTVKAVIKQSLLLKNPQLTEALKDDKQSLEVIHFDKKNRYVVLKVTPAIKALIKADRSRLYLGCKVQEAMDYVHLVQCYNCNRFGHKADACQRRTSSCLYCAGSHRSHTCTLKKQPRDYKCVNCLHSNNNNHTANADHTANDQLCPFVISEHDYAISRLVDSAESKNDYKRKLQSLRERPRHH